MRLTTLSLTSVYGVKRSHGYSGKQSHTIFGFASPSLKKVSVEVPGFPEVSAGHTLTILHESACDWSKVDGWVNHNTGEVAAPDAAGLAIAASVSFAAFVFVALAVEPNWKAVPIFGVFLGAGTYWGFKCARSVLIRRALKDMAASLAAASFKKACINVQDAA